MRLPIDEDELASCVGCGLCLPHCPTYRVTGEETRSPRGRIRLMREVHEGADADFTFVDSMETCIQCRGCETACPSGVPFGRLMEGTRAALADVPLPPKARVASRWQRAGFRALAHPTLVRAASFGAQVPGVARRVGLPRPPLRRHPRRPSGSDVVLFTGCVMDVWQRDVHEASQALLEAAGFGVTFAGGCCGALATHAGALPIARSQIAEVMRSVDGVVGPDVPVLVDAAGCGAQLKDAHHVLETREAGIFGARVRDINEFLSAHLDRLPAGTRLPYPVAIQDPCHLRHVQRAHLPVRTLLGRYAELIELDDDGLCCGAGGAFSMVQPDLANAVRARKLEAIDRTGATVVASANPGCAFHLAAAGVEVRHPVQLVSEALGLG